MTKRQKPNRFLTTRRHSISSLCAAIKSQYKEIGVIARRSDLSLSQRWERIKATVLNAAFQELSDPERFRRYYPRPARPSRRAAR